MVREYIKPGTRNLLFSASGGVCGNPKCNNQLTKDESNVSDIAHIKPNADGGDESYENLICLCKTCHKISDDKDLEGEKERRAWKKIQHTDFEKRLKSHKFEKFEELKEWIKPRLVENKSIYQTYGPAENNDNELWQKFEATILENNRIIKNILQNNIDLFHTDCREEIGGFVLHIDEFEKTRDKIYARNACFPEGVNSIFGIEENLYGFPPSVSALKRYIDYQRNAGLTAELNFGMGILCLVEDGEYQRISLENRLYLQQEFWRTSSFRNKTTELRISDLSYLVSKLTKYQVDFELMDDLFTLKIRKRGREYVVKLAYEYMLSEETFDRLYVENLDIIVNTHSWNGGPISANAQSHAKNLDILCFNNQEFMDWVFK